MTPESLILIQDYAQFVLVIAQGAQTCCIKEMAYKNKLTAIFQWQDWVILKKNYI